VRVGGLGELKDIKRYEVTITFAEAVPVEAFAHLAGVARVEPVAGGCGLRLEMQGPADAVGKGAARSPVAPMASQVPSLQAMFLYSRDPSLEDVCLQYYESDARPAAAPREVSGVV